MTLRGAARAAGGVLRRERADVLRLRLRAFLRLRPRLPPRDQRRLPRPQAESGFCQRNMAIFKHLLELLRVGRLGARAPSSAGRDDDRAARAGRRASSSTAPLSRAVWLLVDRETLTPQRHGSAFLARDGERAAGRVRPLPRRAIPSTPPPAGRGSRCRRSLRLPIGRRRCLRLSDRRARARPLAHARARQNSVLLTERCDHYCLMCSQPPKERDDDWLLDRRARADPPAAARRRRDWLHRRRADDLRRAAARAVAPLRQPAARRRRPCPLQRATLRRLRLRLGLGRRRQSAHDGRHPHLRSRADPARLRRPGGGRLRRDGARHPQPRAARRTDRVSRCHPQADRAGAAGNRGVHRPQPALRRPGRADGPGDDRLRAGQHATSSGSTRSTIRPS